MNAYAVFLGESTAGTFQGEPYKITIDETILPKWTAPHPVSIHQQETFRQELNRMLEFYTIEPANITTPWISSFVIRDVEENKLKKQ